MDELQSAVEEGKVSTESVPKKVTRTLVPITTELHKLLLDYLSSKPSGEAGLLYASLSQEKALEITFNG